MIPLPPNPPPVYILVWGGKLGQVVQDGAPVTLAIGMRSAETMARTLGCRQETGWDPSKGEWVPLYPPEPEIDLCPCCGQALPEED